MKNDNNCKRSNEGSNKLVGAICEHHRVLKDKKGVSESEIKASSILISYHDMVRGYKLCCLNMAEETHRFYRDIDNYELFDIQKSTEIIQANVDKHSKKNGELAKCIKEGSKMFNDLKVKLHDANNAACAMHNCLKSILGFTDDEVPSEVSSITSLAKELSQDGQNAAEALVKIAGIQTFANVEELKPSAKNLVDKMKQFKKTTDEHIKKAGEDAKSAQAELTRVIEELNTEEFRCFEETNTCNGLTDTINFICEGKCEPISTVDDICEDVTKGTSEGNSQNPDQKQSGSRLGRDED
jgi:hypothetical protein